MPVILPIKELRDTTKISETAHKIQEPIFVTKNGYSDLVVMSAELYNYYADVYKIDKAIEESEKEMQTNNKAYDLDEAFAMLNEKYYGKV